MKLLDSFYVNINASQLEEFIEFIDWTIVPKHLLTEKLVNKFHCIKDIEARIWFEQLLNSMHKRASIEFPDKLFFFNGEKYCMEINISKNNLIYSESEVYLKFKDFGFSQYKAAKFIQSMVKRYFNLDLSTTHAEHSRNDLVEKYFKNHEENYFIDKRLKLY